MYSRWFEAVFVERVYEVVLQDVLENGGVSQLRLGFAGFGFEPFEVFFRAAGEYDDNEGPPALFSAV